MKKLGILGGSRFIGFHLCEHALREGYEVHVFNRGITRPPRVLAVRETFGDRKRCADLDAFFGTDFDCVVDLSGYTPRDIQPILDGHLARCGHYLFCSTIHAGRTDRYPYGTYPGDKRRCEELLFEASAKYGVPVTAFRPQGVIGLYDFSTDIQFFYRLSHRIPLVIGPERTSRLNFLPVQDLCRAFLTAAGHPVTFGKVYDVAGDETPDFAEMAALCARVSVSARSADSAEFAGNPAVIRAVEAATITGSICGKRPVGVGWTQETLIADNAPIKHDLGITFTPLEAALSETWRSLQSEPRWLDAGLRRGEAYFIADRPIPVARQWLWKLESVLQLARIRRKFNEYRARLRRLILPRSNA